MTQVQRIVYRFGDFCLEPAERLLLLKNHPLSLTPKTFDALVLLVENAGHLVEKELFIRRLWPDTFVGDDTLAQCISLVRKALHDGTETEWVITVPRRGYRFSGAVRKFDEAPTTQQIATERFDVTDETEAPPEASEIRNWENTTADPVTKDEKKAERVSRPALKPTYALMRGVRLFGAATLIGTVAGVLTYAFLSPAKHPSVTGATQITHSGKVDPVRKMVTDGSRIYFLEREGEHWNVAQTSLAGGETQIVSTPFPNTTLLDLSPDRTEFLISTLDLDGRDMPLWTWPVQGGAPTRVGELTVHDAAWRPDGRQIVFSKEDGAYLADRDGSHITKLAGTDSRPSNFSWSPDGAVVRYSLFPPGIESSSIWEVRADGSNLHQVLERWSNPAVECCGSFSPDGRYYFFNSVHSKTSDLWSAQEKAGLFRKSDVGPVRLTTGPTGFSNPLFVRTDKERLFAFGYNYKTELVKYDPNLQKATVLFPESRAAAFPSFSRDGKWVVYSTSLDNYLWRANRDGSQRRRISETSIVATDPALSPDGTQVAFVNHTTYCENKLYIISAEGGTARELFPDDCEQFDPSWSPDGKYLSFAQAERLPSGKEKPCTIVLLDIATNKLTTLAGSESLRSPSWSPNGRLIAAISEDYHKLMIYDVRAAKWTEFAQGISIAGFLRWSHDGTFLYYQDLRAPSEAVYRIRMHDRKREEVANFDELIRSGVQRCAFSGLAPDGSLIVELLQSHADIYALDLSLP